MTAAHVVEATHRVVRVVSVQDGDSLRVETAQEQKVLTAGGSLVLSDDYVTELHTITTVTQRNRDPRGLPLRLIRLDTPELRFRDPVDPARQAFVRAEAQRARGHVLVWMAEHAGALMVTTYGKDELSRHLADVWVDGDRGDTLTQHMLRLGWDPWVG